MTADTSTTIDTTSAATPERTLTEIVNADYRAAGILESFGLDFCCRGNATLDAACASKGIDADHVRTALAEATRTPDPRQPRFHEWEPDLLVDYIVQQHHAYIRDAIPTIAAHANKVAAVHGAHHPEVIRVRDVFHALAQELMPHMQKEEAILFPAIKSLAVAAREHRAAPVLPFGSVANPIEAMRAEHESAGAACDRIRAITNGYALPADACTTFTLLYRELAAFEDDLHRHVYLENAVLFPRAIAAA